MKAKLLILLVALLLSTAAVRGANPMELRFHNEATDTARITSLLIEASKALPSNAPAGERVAWFASQLLDTPYVAHTLEAPEGEEEMLTIDIDRLDCTTLVETVVALAVTLGEGRTSWRDYVYNLRRLRYRGGETDGYASRLHYVADWTVDAIHKGILRDATLLMPRNSWCVRSIDYMSNHRPAYPALADSAEYARIRRVEQGLRNHRFPYLRSSDLTDRKILSQMREGDVLAFVSTLKDLDVTHMGILVHDPAGSDGWHVVHASSSEGKVVISSRPLARFMAANRQWQGLRLLRLQ